VAVTVEVPVRIRVDPRALDRHLDEVEEATRAAVTRALANATAVIGETRGGFVAHCTYEPVVTWSGAARTEVSRADRSACEAVVRRAVARSVEATFGEPDRAGSGDSLAERLTGDPAEIVDDTRMAGLAGIYLLPGYRDGKEQPVPVRTTRARVELTWRVFPGHDNTWLRRFGADALRARYGDPANGGWPDQTGVIFRNADGTFGISAQREPQGDPLVDITVKKRTEVDPRTLTLREVPIVIHANAQYRLQYAGAATTYEQRLAFFQQSIAPGVADRMRHSTPGRAAAFAEQGLIDLGRRWAAASTNLACFALLIGYGDPIPLESEIGLPPDLNVKLVPIVRRVTHKPRAARKPDSAPTGTLPGTGAVDAGPADRGSTDAGTSPAEAAPTGGPLGDTADFVRLWPVRGVDRKELVCEPFLAEPSMYQLVADFGLRERMRRIARDLEVPECGYLGQFAINAARVIAGRARGIGVASVTASTTTICTVREDGRGNNGFLDVRPGQSPDFEYLRRLARVASQVHDFGNSVMAAYEDPRNAQLVRVDPRWEPGVASWNLRFMGELASAVRGGYMHLYAETCRVLMLQQLRSSRAGILGRALQFEPTFTSFSQALDILGEGVVTLDTLRLAIRHSRTVFTTGTVRQVLSTSEQIFDRNDQIHALPPPIGGVSDRIMAIVGPALIEWRGSAIVAVFKGRAWTADELDMAIASGRGLLNQVDPLFLQVQDLTSLFTRAQREPDSARRYLRDLLSEMLRANREMIDKSSDPEDGAFFALEGSQYIRREGGRDARGLRFELQGIHMLADEQLRPHIGRDRLYADGINQAIGRKANFDDLVAAFSTIGIIVLGLLCAPLGALVASAVTGLAGVAAAVHDVREAGRQTDLYRAMENPELFQHWQEVQLAQLMAGLSVAFSVFDAAGVVRGAGAIVGAAGRALRAGERSAVRPVVRKMIDEVMTNALHQAVSEAAIMAALNELLPLVITPVLVPWLRRQAIEHGTLAEVDAELGGLVPPSAARPAEGGEH
jgi:hypothetical protein